MHMPCATPLLHSTVLGQEVGQLLVLGPYGVAGGGPAVEVRGVHFGAGLQKGLGHLPMASLGGQVQGRAAPSLLGVHVGASCQEELHDLRAPLLVTVVERRSGVPVHGVSH